MPGVDNLVVDKSHTLQLYTNVTAIITKCSTTHNYVR